MWYRKMMINKDGAVCLPDVMIIKFCYLIQIKDTFAVTAKHAMTAKTRMELNFSSLSLEKKEAKSVSTLTYVKMAFLAG